MGEVVRRKIEYLLFLVCHPGQDRHLQTQPYRPRTNGKAERFVQTLLREWAYARLFHTSAERTTALRPWLNHYNFTRPHGASATNRPAPA